MGLSNLCLFEYPGQNVDVLLEKNILLNER